MPKLLMTLDTHGSKASALRKTLEISEQLEKELSQVLKSYSQHLDELAESVETVAIRAQALTTTQKKIDGALQQTNTLVEHLSVPRLVEARIRAGPKAGGLSTFLAAWELLQQSIVVLRGYRRQYIAGDILDLAVSLDKEASLLAFDDFQHLVKRFATVPSLDDMPPAKILTREFLLKYQDLVPREAAERLKKLYEAISKSGHADCIKVYVAVRWSVLEKHQSSIHHFEEIAKLPWLQLEKRFRQWVDYLVKVPIYLVQEQNLAYHIFGEHMGGNVILEICRPAHAVSTSMFTGLMGYKRIPDKIFVLLEVGEKMAGQSPHVVDMLPDEVTKGKLEHIAVACVREARATFSAFCAKIARDASKHTVGNGAVHPMAAQTIAYVRRILTHACAPGVIFCDGEPTGREWTMRDGTARDPDLQRNVEKPLDQIWVFLSIVAASCKSKALAALFLMNNAHYQLKAIIGTGLQGYVSKEFQDDCETKLEEYGALYQRVAWDPLLAIISLPEEDSPKKVPWEREKATIKEKWTQLNAGLALLIEQQKDWLVNDPGIRANLCDAILEDFMVPYRKFWARYQVLPFSKAPSKYLRFAPDVLTDIIKNQILQAQAEPVDASVSGK